MFLLGYIIIEICEIFTVGKFPLNNTVRIVCMLLLNHGMVADKVNRPLQESISA